MEKNNYIRYAATLFIICLAASGLLGVVYNITQPKIIQQALMEEEASLKDVLPQGKKFEAVKVGQDILYYKAMDASDKIIGYAFKTSKRGYSSDIVTMVGMEKDGVIVNIKILSQNETPGLGTRVTEVIQKETLWDVLLKKAKLGAPAKPWFQEQFSGKKAAELDTSVNAITGATITSKAVIDSVKEKAKEIMEKINER